MAPDVNYLGHVVTFICHCCLCRSHTEEESATMLQPRQLSTIDFLGNKGRSFGLTEGAQGTGRG